MFYLSVSVVYWVFLRFRVYSVCAFVTLIKITYLLNFRPIRFTEVHVGVGLL